MRPFVTPLFEVSTEVDFEVRPVVEFRARSFQKAIVDRCPLHRQFPVVIIPPDEATPEQLNVTPAIYRFHAPDNKFSTFIGPRMVAANVLSWPGYDVYKKFVRDVVKSYLELMDSPRPFRYSVGFYNRVPIASVEEFKAVLAQPPSLGEQASLEGLVYQNNSETQAGIALTQIMMRPPDDMTPEPFLSINNVIHNSCDNKEFTLDDLMNWLDRAHDIGKEMIWTLLSESVKSQWQPKSETGNG